MNPTTGAGGKRLSRKAARKEGRARKAAGDDVTRAFKEAQASVDAAELRKAQSATLEALFEALFRVLKHASASGLLALGRPGALQRPESAHLHPSAVGSLAATGRAPLQGGLFLTVSSMLKQVLFSFSAASAGLVFSLIVPYITLHGEWCCKFRDAMFRAGYLSSS